MCFVKKSKIDPVVIQDPIKRTQADASVTKNSNSNHGIRQNIKTAAYGLYDEAAAPRKTLLGE